MAITLFNLELCHRYMQTTAEIQKKVLCYGSSRLRELTRKPNSSGDGRKLLLGINATSCATDQGRGTSTVHFNNPKPLHRSSNEEGPMPRQHSELSISSKKIVHQGFRLLHQLGVRSGNPRAQRVWIEICPLRCACGNNYNFEKNPTHPAREVTDATAIALSASQLAAAHVDSFPSVALLKLAKSAWQLGSCQSLSTAGSAT